MEREDWNRRYEGTDLLWSANPNRMFVEEVEGLRPGRALDLGCGEGRNAVWLAERGWEVTGVDFSDVGLAKGRKFAATRGVEVDWVSADVRSYQPEGGSYDLVVVLFMHLPATERRGVHAAAARALAPGGMLIVLGHDLANLTEGYGGPPNAGILFTVDDVLADLDGLTIERADRVERRVLTDGGERVALDALVRAVRS